MLNWEDVNFIFNEPTLLIGDILLMNTYHERERQLIGGKYDHVAMYVGDAYIIEADGLGVTMSHIYSYGFKENDHAIILRLKDRDDKRIQKVVQYARSKMGMDYGVREAFRVRDYKNSEKHDESNRTFCSRLIGQAYNYAGYKLVDNPDYCAPDDFLDSELLKKIPKPLLPKIDEVRRTFEKTQNDRENSEYLTKLPETFLSFSKLYGDDIQTIDQLIRSAINHPEKDDDAVEILHMSDIFNPQKDTKKLWPWFDKDGDFFARYPSTSDQLFFLSNQFLHFDKTYLPASKQNLIATSTVRIWFPQSKMIAAINDGFGAVLREQIRIRKRLEELYVDVFTRDRTGFEKFVEKYGFYSDFVYNDILNVDLRDVFFPGLS